MDLPLRIPRGGDRISASQTARLIREVRANRLLPSPGVRLTRGPNGTHLGLDLPARRGDGSKLPWTFSCTIAEEEGEEVRTGGWTNCRLQIGMDIDWHSPDLSASPSDTYHVIEGCDSTDDGRHYLEVTLANGGGADSAEIKVADGPPPASDYLAGIIRIVLGEVTDGKIGRTPHFNPVVYKYL